MANSPITLKFCEFRRKRSLKVSIKGREVNDRLSLRIILIVESIFQFIGGDVCSINTAITKHKLLTCKKLLTQKINPLFATNQYLKARKEI